MKSVHESKLKRFYDELTDYYEVFQEICDEVEDTADKAFWREMLVDMNDLMMDIEEYADTEGVVF